MNYINSYDKARAFFKNRFAPNRRKLIDNLKSLRDEINKDTKIQKKGCVVYSTIGLLSGGPMLFALLEVPGISNTAITIGHYVGMTFSVVDMVHRFIKMRSVMNSVDKAEKKLQAHKIIFSELKGFLQNLKEDIETIQYKIENIREIKSDEGTEIGNSLKYLKDIGTLVATPTNIGMFLGTLKEKRDLISHMLLSDSLVGKCVSVIAKHFAWNWVNEIVKEGVKEGTKDCAKKSAKNGAIQAVKEGVKEIKTGLSKMCAPACVIGSLSLDLTSLIVNAKDLSRLSRPEELCAEADILNSVITKMENELEDLDKWFEERARSETELVQRDDN